MDKFVVRPDHPAVAAGAAALQAHSKEDHRKRGNPWLKWSVVWFSCVMIVFCFFLVQAKKQKYGQAILDGRSYNSIMVELGQANCPSWQTMRGWADARGLGNNRPAR